jgi:hypothetical protein
LITLFSFLIQIRKNKYKSGFNVQASFGIALHKKDRALLEGIQSSLGGVGKISKQRKDSIQYRVNSISQLAVIISHFDKYPLITQKRADYELFKKGFELINQKKHLTSEGLLNLVAIKASLNNGLSVSLKEAFPNITPFPRPIVELPEKVNSNWLTGFVSAEGCFLILIYKGATRTGFIIKLRFQITQHSRDAQLMQSLVSYLGCGHYYARSTGLAGDFMVEKFIDINKNIIPLFKKHPIQGIKELDFSDFCKVAEIMKTKEHLTEQGLKDIRKIKNGMNRLRST